MSVPFAVAFALVGIGGVLLVLWYILIARRLFLLAPGSSKEEAKQPPWQRRGGWCRSTSASLTGDEQTASTKPRVRKAVPLGLSIAPAAVLTVAVIADFPLQIWLLIVSILMIRKREANAETLREREVKQAL